MKIIFDGYQSKNEFDVNGDAPDNIIDEFKKDQKCKELMDKYIDNNNKIKNIIQQNKEILKEIKENFNEFKNDYYPEYMI